MYIGRSQEQLKSSWCRQKRRCLHEELDHMMQGIICITTASQMLLLIYTCCFPLIAIVHSLFHYMLCFHARLLHFNVCPSIYRYSARTCKVTASQAPHGAMATTFKLQYGSSWETSTHTCWSHHCRRIDFVQQQQHMVVPLPCVGCSHLPTCLLAGAWLHVLPWDWSECKSSKGEPHSAVVGRASNCCCYFNPVQLLCNKTPSTTSL